MTRELALFAGAGGGLLATHCLLGWRTVCTVEIEPYRREILLRRQRDGVLDLFPIWDDVRTFDGRPWRGKVDVVTAGFPCQPWSTAGKRQGEADKRNLWPDTMRIIREVGPHYVLLENVPGLLAHEYFGTILGQLAEGGYDCRWDCIPASSIGAEHQRDRLWIVAYTAGGGALRLPVRPWRPRQAAAHVAGNGEEVSDATELVTAGRGGWWDAEPAVGRVVDGLAHRVDRLAAIGDGQVPAVVVRAWETLTERR